MPRRTLWVLVLLLLVLVGLVACSGAQESAHGASGVMTPSRTPRPTWTPAMGGVSVATPTLDPTRYPVVQVAAASMPATPQLVVPGSTDTIFVPVGPANPSGVQTVVIIIVTATPPPSPTPTPLPPTPTPGPTDTPGPPTATPTPSQTPLPPVVVKVKSDKTSARTGPGTGYPLVAQLAAGTEITVVGRNRAGTWWKVCCINGSDVWISDAMVTSSGPLYTVPEVANIPPPPPPPPTKAPPATVAPTPTFAWPFRAESVQTYPLSGENILRVVAKVYNGATTLWGYKLRVRRLSTGQEWLSDGSQIKLDYEVVEWPLDGKPVFDIPNDCRLLTREGLRCVAYNVKWDSNQVSVPPGDDVWEVSVTDGAGQPLSAPVRLETSAANPHWNYVVFTNRP